MQTPDHRHHILQLLQARGGYITSAEVSAAKLPRVELTRLLQAGKVLRLARGVYRLTDLGGLEPADAEATDLLEVQLRFPAARPCLVSALHLHGLSTTRPSRLQFAVPNNRQTLNFPDLPLETYYFSPGMYSAGLTTLNIRGRALTTYTPEKTLVDLLRYAPKFGRELYLEGLKKGLLERRLNRHQLSAHARAARVWTALARDLEVLGHDQDH